MTKRNSKMCPTFFTCVWFLTYFLLNELWPYILSKGCKPDNFESNNSLKLSFMNISSLRLNLVDCESFLELNSPVILALCETNLDDSIDSGNLSVRGYLPLIRKDSTTHTHPWSCSLSERRTSFCIGLISRKPCRFLLMFSTVFTSLCVLLLPPLSITFVFIHVFWFYFIYHRWRFLNHPIC